jgi:hypothetical protein
MLAILAAVALNTSLAAAEVRGHVTLEGLPFPGVIVSLDSRCTDPRQTFTSLSGEFRFDGVPSGCEYRLRAEIPGAAMSGRPRRFVAGDGKSPELRLVVREEEDPAPVRLPDAFTLTKRAGVPLGR